MERMSAMPIMPIEPAKEVKTVLPFLVRRLLKLNARAVINDIDDLPIFLCSGSFSLSCTSRGLVSPVIFPSARLTTRLAYFSASSGLCVTMITSLSFATSFSKSITCMLVSESNAPVGSSAKSISGSFTNARAIATLCI